MPEANIPAINPPTKNPTIKPVQNIRHSTYPTPGS